MSAVLEKDAQPKQTSLSELRAMPAVNLPAVHMGFDTSAGFDLMQRGAKLLAASSLVPKEYQGNLPNCVIALNMASRIGADPLLVMQNLYVVHGRPGWSSKFLIASFNQCGRFSAIRFEWTGKPGEEAWGCKAWATEKATGEKITGPLITIALAKKEGWHGKTGSKWQTIPELMLMYRSAGWLVNTHAPEISMGLNTVEELGDVFDASGDGAGNFAVTTDDLRKVDTQTGEIVSSEPEKKTEAVKQPGPDDDPTLGIPGAADISHVGASNGGAKAEVKDAGKPKVELPKLLAQFSGTSDPDILDAAASLIGELDDFGERNTATKAYQDRRAELTKPKAKK